MRHSKMGMVLGSMAMMAAASVSVEPAKKPKRRVVVEPIPQGPETRQQRRARERREGSPT